MLHRYTEVAEECTKNTQLGDGSIGDVLRRTFDETVAAEGLADEALHTFADAWLFREKLQRSFDGFFSTDDCAISHAWWVMVRNRELNNLRRLSASCFLASPRLLVVVLLLLVCCGSGSSVGG